MSIVILQRIMKHSVSLNQGDFLHEFAPNVNAVTLSAQLVTACEFYCSYETIPIKNKVLHIKTIKAATTTPRKTEVKIFANKGRHAMIHCFPHLKQLVVG
jgi:hypothetical protein